SGIRNLDELIGEVESEAAWLREAVAAGVTYDEEAGGDAGWFPLVAPTLEVARRFWRYKTVPLIPTEKPAVPAAGEVPPSGESPVPARRVPPPAYVLEWTGRNLADEAGTVEELAEVLEKEAVRLREMKAASVEVDPGYYLRDCGKHVALVTADPV